MRWAFATCSVLVGVAAVCLTAMVFRRPVGRVLEVLAVAGPVFFVLGLLLGRIGRAAARETVDLEYPAIVESARAEETESGGEPAPEAATPQGT